MAPAACVTAAGVIHLRNIGGMASVACVLATVVIHLVNIGGMAERFNANDLKDHGTPNLPHISVDLVRPSVTHMAVNGPLGRKRSRKRP
jgi:hypothetical protein